MVLAVAAVLLLCGGGGVAFVAVRAIVERANDTPAGVEVGEEFRHDSFVADDGWDVVDERGDFDIVDLTLTNQALRSRPAYFQFSVYRDEDVIGIISCTVQLGPRESDVMDCFSADEYVDDFDAIRVADTF